MYEQLQQYLEYVSVPFDEDDKDRTVWFLDHDYLESMYTMFKKVNGMYYIRFLLWCTTARIYCTTIYVC